MGATRKNNCLRNHQHDFYHVENQAQCLKTIDGLPAVDFIVSMEDLESDFEQLLEEIRLRLPKNLQEEFVLDIGSSLSLKQLQKGPQSGQYAVQMFQQCGASCVHALTTSFQEDFVFFNYINCSMQV
eukprot:TRINITY_DN31367_c0_g1_i4.p2 TRINITY_DN31367_c0_g1~~TRINITY_DN31367_c0_g1_i4.p2  ORF type:complete len:127 (+),score=15.77 TRINITY_DN31367_c0_g1_i4:188-568(+)